MKEGWDRRLADAAAVELDTAVGRLCREQAACWPLLAAGIAGLQHAQTKRLRVGVGTIAVRHIPHRLKSTTARVDTASVGARPCFLCEANLPPEQRGVAFDDDWAVLCNPFPILDRHLTVVHRQHTPQRLSGRIGTLLALARGLPRSFVIYNGAECGASAPDHLHFQAGDRTLFPIEADTRDREGPLLLDHPSRPILLRGEETSLLADEIERAIEAVALVTGRQGEPLVNVAAFWADGSFTVYVFARRRHRGEAFHRGELLVSPAAIDLCGVLVAPRAEDFDRLDEGVVRDLYDEVMLGIHELEAVADHAGVAAMTLAVGRVEGRSSLGRRLVRVATPPRHRAFAWSPAGTGPPAPPRR